MRQIIKLSLLTNWLHLPALCMFMLAINGCAVTQKVPDKAQFSRSPVEVEAGKNEYFVAKGDDVIGRLAAIRLEKGDTLPDVARHFSLGINAISAANPGVDVWVPEAGERIVLPLSFILPDAPRKGIVVNLGAMRLFHFKGDGKSVVVSTYPVGIGTKERPTPMGQMRVERKATRPTWYVPASIAADHRKKGDPLPTEVPPGPDNPLGECALYLSKPGYLIHGSNKPASIGLKATNGCMRIYPEKVKMLCDDTPVKTPVLIVNQPYLIGQRNGVLYMEAHTPLEDSGTVELEKIYAKLKGLEKKYSCRLDWEKIRKIQAEARGIPVPVCVMSSGSEEVAERIVEVEHPRQLFGRPEVPDLKLNAWYILAAELRDQTEARRLAAIINHQGPQIPARVLDKSSNYRVIAGPFNEITEAKEALKRLKVDLEIDGILIEPDYSK